MPAKEDAPKDGAESRRMLDVALVATINTRVRLTSSTARRGSAGDSRELAEHSKALYQECARCPQLMPAHCLPVYSPRMGPVSVLKDGFSHLGTLRLHPPMTSYHTLRYVNEDLQLTLVGKWSSQE